MIDHKDVKQDGLMSQSDDLLKLENQLCFAVYSANLSFNHLYRQLLKPLGLTYSQYLVMLILWEKNHQIVSEIGKQLYLETSTLTPMLKRLEVMGCIHRRKSEHDERQVIVSLTQKGIDLKPLAKNIPLTIHCETEQSIEELLQLKQKLHKLRNRLND